jgi:integrase
MGIMGACRSIELYEMKMEDLNDLNATLIITIPKTKTKIVRTFILTDEYYNFVKKYMNLRPPHVTINSFFLNYQKAKCTTQKVGKNKFGIMGNQIASYLGLPNPEKYTGHCYRRSSATLYIDGGGDITGLKRHGGWKSTQVAEGYIDQSIQNKVAAANTIAKQLNNNVPSTSTSTTTSKTINNISENSANHIITQNTPSSIQFINCSNINIHFVEK